MTMDQMPAAPNSGPAPVPYAGSDQSPEPPGYSAAAAVLHAPGVEVMSGVTGTMGVREAGYAHDVNAGLLTPYVAGSPSPIYAGGDADAGGRDDVAASVAEAVTNAEARYGELQGDTYGQGSTIGDVMTLPPSPLDPGVIGGLTLPEGAYYDPGRDY